MSNLVIVAVPEEGDSIWDVSSEKVPHLTLLDLGDLSKVDNLHKVLEFVQHAVNTHVLDPFYLTVDYRGVLGSDLADVLFFKNSMDLARVRSFRESLLKNDAIQKAYLNSEQFPTWLPHITIGYPDAPAKKIQYPIYSVCFKRIAVWFDDFEGLEFRLEYAFDDSDDMEVSMSTELDDILAHYGIKGMKWGRRSASRAPTNVSVSKTPKGRVITKGGENQPAHPDAVTAKVAVQKAKKSGIQSLSNQDLQSLATRLDLEQRVSKLASNDLTSAGEKLVNAALAGLS